MGKPRRALRLELERLDGRWLPSGYTAAQVRHAYGIDAVSFTTPSGQTVAGDGSGEIIAIIDAYHDPNLASDLQVFDQANGLPGANLTVVNQAGGQTNSTWAAEETLDVEWAHAIAPGAAIVVVEASSDTLPSLMSAVDVARYTPGVVAISMSYGFSESASEVSTDSHFTTPAGHQGITFFASSGDNGQAAGPVYPASSPGVVAVGGTTLAIDPSGNYLGETAWSGSGGGFSPFEREPSYQSRVQTSGRRLTPDVAFLGDPNTGVTVYETPPRQTSGSWTTVGGTSLGAPAWAAIVAIADQGRALAGQGSLDGPTQTLPTLYAMPASDFHAISAPGVTVSTPASGVNLFGVTLPALPFIARRGPKVHRAAARANTRTGLGSPVAPSVIAGLVASDLTVPLTTTASGRRPARAARSAAGHRHALALGPADAFSKVQRPRH